MKSDKWLARLLIDLRQFRAPSFERAAEFLESDAALKRLFVHLRASTIRGPVRAWSTFQKWWTASGQERFPKTASDFVRYLTMRAEEPCGPTVITTAIAALKCYEEAAGLEKVDRMSEDPWLQKQVRGLTAELQSGRPVSKQAPKLLLGPWVAIKDAVFDEATPVTLRC